MCALVEAAAAPQDGKKVDTTDGKFEDFLTAGVRTAQLVAAGARVASDVAGAVLTLCRSASDDRDDKCGISNAGSAAARLIGQPVAATTPANQQIEYAYRSREHEFGPPCADCTNLQPETKASTPLERKQKRGRPKKEADAAWANQCPETAKRQVLEAV